MNSRRDQVPVAEKDESLVKYIIRVGLGVAIKHTVNFSILLLFAALLIFVWFGSFQVNCHGFQYSKGAGAVNKAKAK
jgi:hypothetical protein